MIGGSGGIRADCTYTYTLPAQYLFQGIEVLFFPSRNDVSVNPNNVYANDTNISYPILFAGILVWYLLSCADVVLYGILKKPKKK